MASSFRDLELLMDHNIELSSVSSNAEPSPFLPRILPVETRSSLSSVTDKQAEQQPTPGRPLPAFASLSLAFGPALAPSIIPNPCLPKARGAAAIGKAATALPSQRKPMPLMPAISAATGVDVANVLYTPSTGSKNSRASTAFPDYQRLPDRGNNSADPANGAAARRASIVWFRNDLRIHDNEALFTASKESLSVLPVYVFDSRDYGKSASGFDKTGPYRAKFLLQSVSNLREKLRQLGSDLVIRVGKPEEVLVSLAKSIGADAFYAHQEVSYDELQSESKVTAALQEESVDVKFFWGSTLFHLDDLPFKLEEMPATYAAFREKVQNLKIRHILEAPKQLKSLPIRGRVEAGDLPTLEELGVKSPSTSAQKQGQQNPVAASLVGGEVEALERLRSFAADHAKQSSKLMKQSSSKAGKDSCADSLYGSNFSCKISPWLALGCLSPRRMFEELDSGEQRGIIATASAAGGTGANEQGLSWLIFELLWRDFFRFITRKYAASRQGLDTKVGMKSSAPA